MRRIGLVVVLAISFILTPLVAGAQQAGKVYRVAYLGIGSGGASEPTIELLLSERGWVAGKNLVITYHWAEGKYDRLPALAAELVRLEPQVIVAAQTAATRAAKDATSTIPIVMVNVSDPIGEGLIASFAHPGRERDWAHPHSDLGDLQQAAPVAQGGGPPCEAVRVPLESRQPGRAPGGAGHRRCGAVAAGRTASRQRTSG